MARNISTLRTHRLQRSLPLRVREEVQTLPWGETREAKRRLRPPSGLRREPEAREMWDMVAAGQN
jgi:hypothetical protein